MPRKKSFIKIPKNVILICPKCNGKNKCVVSKDVCPQKFTCPKCNEEVFNPITKCCVICAFSNKKCPRSLIMDAKIKGLEIR